MQTELDKPYSIIFGLLPTDEWLPLYRILAMLPTDEWLPLYRILAIEMIYLCPATQIGKAAIFKM